MDPTRRVRVCIVAPSLDILGGQAVAAQRLLERLREEPALDMDFLPVNPRLPGPLRALQRIKYVRTIVTSIAYVSSLLARAWRYDVLHIFSASYWSFLLAPAPAILIGRLFGRRVILNYRSGEAEDHLTRWRAVALPILRAAHRIVVPSGYLVDVFAKFGLEAVAIHNFVELERIPYRERFPLQPKLLSNRNFEALYNVEAVLRAFALVQQEFPDAALIVAGHGNQRQRLVGLAAELGLRNTEFTGAIRPPDMPSLYDRADIYVNASLIDNMPQSILEGFAAGTPVVTSDAGGIPFVVDQGVTGVMVPAGDADALAAGVIALLRDPERALRLSRAARDTCLRTYAWEAVASEWKRIYRGDR